ncbi:hypothetical protein AVEN_38120-1 [Araneus ventricosus]|uniref:SCAN box domain-containing protein n=1 Tax=Araneus ventricosus TaxID=182803 RepID=A0A4Y2HYG0_ARAVE|nr:hypothetical protein AVEN_38120-1 [Araneus ventricosus]
MFERQARTTENEESDWASQLMALLPLDLAQIIVKVPEEIMKDYLHIKGILLERFKIKPETFRVKFTQHQIKSGALWKELVLELKNYLEGWLDGVKVNDFETLKNLMITYQIKWRVPPEFKDHFLDEWGKTVDPSELAGKLYEYESVRSARKQHLSKALEQKSI